MDAQRLKEIVDAIRAMKVRKKPTVGDFEKASGINSNGKEIAAAWKHIVENPVDEDIPHTDDSIDDDTPQPLDGVTVHIKLSAKAIKQGLERRCRAGHCFDKTGKTFSAGEIDEDQIKAIAADPFLTMKSEG